MELYKKISMKDMLAQSLYLLMKEKQFDKITIKEISSKTGVIRGTFYNHFYDKYEALEYLTYSILIEQNKEDMHESDDSLINILHRIDNEKEYFEHCFTVEGQNGFEFILTKIFKQLITKYLNVNKIDFSNTIFEKELFIEINANNIVFIIKKWMNKSKNKNAQEIYETLGFILTKSPQEIILELSKTHE